MEPAEAGQDLVGGPTDESPVIGDLLKTSAAAIWQRKSARFQITRLTARARKRPSVIPLGQPRKTQRERRTAMGLCSITTETELVPFASIQSDRK
jgi:hypothetical protein